MCVIQRLHKRHAAQLNLNIINQNHLHMEQNWTKVLYAALLNMDIISYYVQVTYMEHRKTKGLDNKHLNRVLKQPNHDISARVSRGTSFVHWKQRK